MALYKLTKNDRNEIHIYKDGREIDLKTDIHDFQIPVHGWGGAIGDSSQISFALAYDVLGNKETALEKYVNINQLISNAAPFTLELSTDVLNEQLSRSVDVDDDRMVY